MHHPYLPPWGRWLLALSFTLLLAPLLPAQAQAAAPNIFLVDSTADAVDADTLDDVCDADPGPARRCTLRAAVMQANATGGLQTIVLQPKVYRLTLPGVREEFAVSGDLDISSNTIISGTVAGRLQSTIDATGLGDRVLDVKSAQGASIAVTIKQLRITGGDVSVERLGGGGIGVGAGVALTIEDSSITNNLAAAGGGIFFSNGGTLTIRRSTIANNQAIRTIAPEGSGGGIFSFGPMTITQSTIRDNRAHEGAGIHINTINGLAATITNSTISGNSAVANGGGIVSLATKLTINNSTLSGNSAGEGGGGMYFSHFEPLTLRHVTIAANRAITGGGLAWQKTKTAQLNAVNTLLANNVSANCDTTITFVNSTNNLSTDESCGLAGASNQLGVPASIGPLQLNGGPTRTHALLPASHAINAGVAASFAIERDQRGALRIPPGRLPSPPANPFDIGAFELTDLGVGTPAITSAQAAAAPEQPTTLALTWTHPNTWSDLNTVDVQLRHDESTPLWVRFTEGITETEGITATNGLALYNSDGTLAGLGEPGQALVLESDMATLDLAQSTVQGSGPGGKAVTLTLAVRLKPAAAAKRYVVTLLASDDAGALQGPNEVGSLAVGPFTAFLPQVVR